MPLLAINSRKHFVFGRSVRPCVRAWVCVIIY